MHRIGIDLGGTNIAAGVVDERGGLVFKTSVPTQAEDGPEAVTERMAACARQVIRETGAAVSGVGIGSPGIVNADTGTVVTSNNIVMKNFPMAARFRAHLDLPVYMANDANCAALGEQAAGAGRDCRTMVMITLGTGIGSGIIIDGKIYPGGNYAGAELGHMLIRAGGEDCTCGQKGCWEAYASATALIRQGKRAAQAHPESLLARAERITGRVIFEAWDAGDETARAVVEQYLDYLTDGLVNVVNIFQPEVILLGGGVAGQGEKILAPLRERLAPRCFISGTMELPRLAQAALGNDAGIIGAAMLVPENGRP